MVVILRAHNADLFGEVAITCATQGLSIVEFSMNTPGASAAIAALGDHRPAGLLLGAGTMTTPQLAQEAVRACAEFLVTP
ncbi:MAG: 2-dehydro-3-deoxyphosphogluconate aldolase, partial [Pseudonocardiaceae bacterium]